MRKAQSQNSTIYYGIFQSISHDPAHKALVSSDLILQIWGFSSHSGMESRQLTQVFSRNVVDLVTQLVLHERVSSHAERRPLFAVPGNP